MPKNNLTVKYFLTMDEADQLKYLNTLRERKMIKRKEYYNADQKFEKFRDAYYKDKEENHEG